jgi:hypothetical protein
VRGGAFVILNHDGMVRIERGFIRPEDEKPRPVTPLLLAALCRAADPASRIGGGDACSRPELLSRMRTKSDGVRYDVIQTGRMADRSNRARTVGCLLESCSVLRRAFWRFSSCVPRATFPGCW